VKVSETKTEHAETLTLEVYGPEEHPESLCAEVTFTAAYARRLLGLMAFVRGLSALDDSIYQLRRWDYSATYLERDWDAPQDVVLAKGELPDLRLECHIMHVSGNDVQWTALDKYTSDEFSTETVGLVELEAMVIRLEKEEG